jgi:hypothetical protein
MMTVFHQHFLTFSLAKFDAFLDEWQLVNGTRRLANGAQNRRILGHKFGEISCALCGRMLLKLNGEFFAKRRAPASFGEIDPWYNTSFREKKINLSKSLIHTVE